MMFQYIIFCIILIFLTIIFIIYKKDQMDLLDQKFYDTMTLYPELKIISDNIQMIEKELSDYESDQQKEWIEWPEKHLYEKKKGWLTIPIYGFNYWSKQSLYFPNLVKILKQIKNIKLVTFSKLKSGVKLNPHHGWAFHSNYVIRNHYGITVPPNKCAIIVEDDTRYHQRHKWLSFDDSKEHSAYNMSDSDRIVLIIDMERPDYIKLGISESEDSDELRDFIKNNKK